MDILRQIRSFSLRTKLVILFSLLVGAIALFMYFYVPARLEDQAREAHIEQTQNIAQMSAFTISSALYFSDLQILQEELLATRQDSDVIYIVVHNDTGKVVVAYNMEYAKQVNYTTVDDPAYPIFNKSIYKISKPIVYNNKIIGIVYLGMSMSDVQRAVTQSRNNIATVSLIVFFLGILAVFGFSSLITKPLRLITKTMEDISEGDLTHRAEVSSDDEVGHVAASFNKMVTEVQRAQTELEELNRTLEHRVQERTRELQNEIGERETAEVKLRESEERYRLLVEMSPDGVMIHQEGKFVFMNMAGAKLVGARFPEELLGKPILDFVHPDYRMNVIERVNKLGEGVTAPLLEEKLVKLDGTAVDVEIVGIPTMFNGRSAVQVVVRDITERKKAEEALRASELEMRALFASIQDDISVLDAHGKYLKIAPTNQKLIYRTGTELIGKTLYEIFPEPHAEVLLSKIREALEIRRTVQFEYSLIADNNETWFLGSVSPMSDDTVMFIARDITERKLSEKEYKELEQKLIQSQKLESIGTLAGGIAHDFNNILAIILGYSNILQLGMPSPESLKQSLNVIDKAVERGASLVRQILTFARRTENLFGLLDANIIVKEHAKMLMETFPKFITITLKIDPNVPQIFADPTQFHQTLLNLCVNARDAMPDGGTLTIQTKLVGQEIVRKRFSEAAEKQYLRLTIQDTGVGMDIETQKRIFDPFFTTKGVGKGTGLGLAVVYGIIQSHRGFIEVESVPGKGTTIHSYFPVPATEEKHTSNEQQLNAIVRGGTETIFFIEDEDALREMVKLQLEAHGYRVRIAIDGEEAIEEYKRYQHEIELVFSDIGLPKMSGEQVFLRLKEVNPSLKFIFATGFIEPDRKNELIKAGVKEILHKPYKFDEVLQVIRQALDEVPS